MIAIGLSIFCAMAILAAALINDPAGRRLLLRLSGPGRHCAARELPYWLQHPVRGLKLRYWARQLRRESARLRDGAA